MTVDTNVNFSWDAPQINELGDRVLNLILKKEKQKHCSINQECPYISEHVKSGVFNPRYAGFYLTTICLKYPDACELNLENKVN